MPLVVGTLAAAAIASAVLWLAALAVRERLLLEGRRVVAPPRLRPALLGVRAATLFFVTSFAFAMLESTIHWREGLGWHGLSCLLGPVHRDAIPILAGSRSSRSRCTGRSSTCSNGRGGCSSSSASRSFAPAGRAPRARAAGLAPGGRALLANGPRGPPQVHGPRPLHLFLRGVDQS